MHDEYDYGEPYGAAAIRDIAAEREKRETAELSAKNMRGLAVEALGLLTLSDYERAKAKLVKLCEIIPKP